MAPTGELRSLEVEVESTPGADTMDHRVTVQADLREVSIRPDGAVPGIVGLSGKLRSDPRGGRFELDGGALELVRRAREPRAPGEGVPPDPLLAYLAALGDGVGIGKIES